MNREMVNKWTLLLVVFLISAVFLAMIRQFLLVIVLAGIFSAITYPMYRKFEIRFGGRRLLASAITIILIIFVVLVPLSGLVGIIATQAVKIGTVAKPWMEQQFSTTSALSQFLQSLPFYETIEPYRNQIIEKAGKFAGSMSIFIIDKLSSATIGTVNIIIDIFIMLYCIFFFLIQGDKTLKKILYYLPLKDHDERRILDKFTSVTRATLKGTLVIGVFQGGMAGGWPLPFSASPVPCSGALSWQFCRSFPVSVQHWFEAQRQFILPLPVILPRVSVFLFFAGLSLAVWTTCFARL